MRITKGKGIYGIRNTIDGRVYVGSTTVGFYRRWQQHRSDLKHGRHRNQYLQRAWDKYGSKSFVFEVLESIDDPANILVREQHWVDRLHKDGRCYNIAFQVQPLSNPRANVKKYDVTLVSPNGVIYERIINLRAFSLEHGLDPVAMYALCAHGRIKRHRGWSLFGARETRGEAIARTAAERMRDPEYKQRCLSSLHSAKTQEKARLARLRKTYAFVDPAGQIYENITDLRSFCAVHDLHLGAMKSVHNPNDKLQSYRGWRKYTPPQDTT